MSTSEVAAVGAWWFLSSAILSTYANGAFLQVFEAPFLLTALRFFGSALLGLLSSSKNVSRKDFRLFLLPSILLAGANYANGLALQLAGLTLTYTVKAAIPVATVIVRKFQGVQYSLTVYLTLIPTVVGVALAAAGELELSVTGFAAALSSMLLQTFLNMTAKHALSESKVSGAEAQFVMATTCALFFAPPLVLKAYRVADILALNREEFQVMLLAAFAYHSEYSANFMFSSRVGSLAFSITDIARRLCIIAVGSVLFDKPLTDVNKVGIVICFAGVLWYSLVDKSPIKERKEE